MHTLNYEIRIKAMLSARTYKDAVKHRWSASGGRGLPSPYPTPPGTSSSCLECEVDKQPFLSFVLKEAEEKIKRLVLIERSDMVARSIEDLSIESETGMRIIAIKRGKRWIYDPEEETDSQGRGHHDRARHRDGSELLESMPPARRNGQYIRTREEE